MSHIAQTYPPKGSGGVVGNHVQHSIKTLLMRRSHCPAINSIHNEAKTTLGFQYGNRYAVGAIARKTSPTYSKTRRKFQRRLHRRMGGIKTARGYLPPNGFDLVAADSLPRNYILRPQVIAAPILNDNQRIRLHKSEEFMRQLYKRVLLSSLRRTVCEV